MTPSTTRAATTNTTTTMAAVLPELFPDFFTPPVALPGPERVCSYQVVCVWTCAGVHVGLTTAGRAGAEGRVLATFGDHLQIQVELGSIGCTKKGQARDHRTTPAHAATIPEHPATYLRGRRSQAAPSHSRTEQRWRHWTALWSSSGPAEGVWQ